jgi:hypothetical protein
LAGDLGGRGRAIAWRWVSLSKGGRLAGGIAMVGGGVFAFVRAVGSDRTRGEVIGGFNLRQKELFCRMFRISINEWGNKAIL